MTDSENGLLLRPPARIEAPERLVQVARSYDGAPRWDNWSSPAIELIARESPTLSGVAGYQSQSFTLGRGSEVEQVTGEWVTGRYFEVLGVRPHLGRLIRPENDLVPAGHPVVVLSHGFWTRRFGADPGIVGKTVPIGAEPYEVVGVAPSGFAGPDALGSPPQLWVPSMQHPGFYGDLPFEEWGFSWLNGVGRLAEGVGLEDARASMETVTAQLRTASAQDDVRVLLGEGIGLAPEERFEASQVSMVLLGVVGLVLLLTCLNVANLFLARAASRTSEVGVRKALGAGRGRLARQLMTESLLLAALATLLAVPLVFGVSRFLPLLVPYPLAVSTAPDSQVLTFLAIVGLATGVLFGLVPAWATSRGDVAGALQDGRKQGTRGRTRLLDSLVVAQLALSLGLVAGATLLGRSVANARSAEPGFDPGGLVVGSVDLESTGRYDADRGREFYRQVLDEAPDPGRHRRNRRQPGADSRRPREGSRAP